MEISDTWKEQLSYKKDPSKYDKFYLNKSGSGLCEPPKKSYMNNCTRLHLKLNPKTYMMYFSNKIFLKGTYDTYKKLGIRFPIYTKEHKKFYYNFNGECFNANLAKYALMYQSFKSVADWNDIKTYCEIGSGYGGLVELLQYNTEIEKYILIDFPEMLSLAKKYLKNYYNISYITVDNYKEIDKPDMFLNSDSFVEMTKNSIQEYFDFMQSFKNVYLLSYNRVYREEGDCVNSENTFPYDKKWNMLYKQFIGSNMLRIPSDTIIRISKR